MIKDKFIIKGLSGKKTLKGEITVRGSKNAILPVMASSILFKDAITITNVPKIEDVSRMNEILNDLGISVLEKDDRTLVVNGNKVSKTTIDSIIAKKMRASVILTGPILARFGKLSFPHPGGCVIGARPIDIFIEGFKKMGAKIVLKDENYLMSVPGGKLVGTDIFMKVQSVTATEAFVMAGVLAKGKTTIKNVALEPEIISLCEFLISCGAKIKGLGTTTLEITGGGLLSSKGKKYKTIPDRLEAGSFLILGSLCADDLLIKNCDPTHLEILIELLRHSGVKIETTKNSIHIKNNKNIPNKKFNNINIRTHEYPGFSTDLQSPMVVFLTQATGESMVFETIFEGRLNYVEYLTRMGANIIPLDQHRILIKGPTPLKGKELVSPDIRAGLAFIIAAIVAEGQSVVNELYYIDRGYENIEDRLRAIGVDIIRIKGDETIIK